MLTLKDILPPNKLKYLDLSKPPSDQLQGTTSGASPDNRQQPEPWCPRPLQPSNHQQQLRPQSDLKALRDQMQQLQQQQQQPATVPSKDDQQKHQRQLVTAAGSADAKQHQTIAMNPPVEPAPAHPPVELLAEALGSKEQQQQQLAQGHDHVQQQQQGQENHKDCDQAAKQQQHQKQEQEEEQPVQQQPPLETTCTVQHKGKEQQQQQLEHPQEIAPVVSAINLLQQEYHQDQPARQQQQEERQQQELGNHAAVEGEDTKPLLPAPAADGAFGPGSVQPSGWSIVGGGTHSVVPPIGVGAIAREAALAAAAARGAAIVAKAARGRELAAARTARDAELAAAARTARDAELAAAAAKAARRTDLKGKARAAVSVTFAPKQDRGGPMKQVKHQPKDDSSSSSYGSDHDVIDAPLACAAPPAGATGGGGDREGGGHGNAGGVQRREVQRLPPPLPWREVVGPYATAAPAAPVDPRPGGAAAAAAALATASAAAPARVAAGAGAAAKDAHSGARELVVRTSEPMVMRERAVRDRVSGAFEQKATLGEGLARGNRAAMLPGVKGVSGSNSSGLRAGAPASSQSRMATSGPVAADGLGSNGHGGVVYKGVHRMQTATEKYIARISHKGQPLSLGHFAKAEEAARAYDIAALALRGFDTVTNFPKMQYSSGEVAKVKEQLLLEIEKPNMKPPGAGIAVEVVAAAATGGGATAAAGKGGNSGAAAAASGPHWGMGPNLLRVAAQLQQVARKGGQSYAKGGKEGLQQHHQGKAGGKHGAEDKFDNSGLGGQRGAVRLPIMVVGSGDSPDKGSGGKSGWRDLVGRRKQEEDDKGGYMKVVQGMQHGGEEEGVQVSGKATVCKVQEEEVAVAAIAVQQHNYGTRRRLAAAAAEAEGMGTSGGSGLGGNDTSSMAEDEHSMSQAAAAAAAVDDDLAAEAAAAGLCLLSAAALWPEQEAAGGVTGAGTAAAAVPEARLPKDGGTAAARGSAGAGGNGYQVMAAAIGLQKAGRGHSSAPHSGAVRGMRPSAAAEQGPGTMMQKGKGAIAAAAAERGVAPPAARKSSASPASLAAARALVAAVPSAAIPAVAAAEPATTAAAAVTVRGQGGASNGVVAPEQQQPAYQGVHRLQYGAPQYVACIMHEEKPLLLGHFPCAGDAAKAYDQAALALEGMKAVTNFPKAQYSFIEVVEMEEKVQQLLAVLRGHSDAAAAAGAGGSSINNSGCTYRGVYTVGGDGDNRRYAACVADDGEQLLLGQFSTAEEAAKVYDQAVLAVNGIRALTNFPKAQYSFVEVAETEQLVNEIKQLMQPGALLNGGRNSAAAAAEAGNGGGEGGDLHEMVAAGEDGCREAQQQQQLHDEEEELGQQGPAAMGLSRGSADEDLDADMADASPGGVFDSEQLEGSQGEEEQEEEAMDVDGAAGPAAVAVATAQSEGWEQLQRGSMGSLLASRIPLAGRRSSGASGGTAGGASAAGVVSPRNRPPQFPPSSAPAAAPGSGAFTRRAKQQGFYPVDITTPAAGGSAPKSTSSSGSKGGGGAGSKVKGVGQYGTDKAQGVYRAWVVVKGKGIHLGRHYTSEQEAVRDHDCAVLALGLKHEQLNQAASTYSKEEVAKLVKLLKERGLQAKPGTSYTASTPPPAGAGGGGEEVAGKGEKRRASAPAAVSVVNEEEGLMEAGKGKRRCLKEAEALAVEAAALNGGVSGSGEGGRPGRASAAAAVAAVVAAAGGSGSGRGIVMSSPGAKAKGTASDVFLSAAAAGAAAGKAAAAARKRSGSEEAGATAAAAVDAGGGVMARPRRRPRREVPNDDHDGSSEDSGDEDRGAGGEAGGARYKGIRKFEMKGGEVMFRPYLYGKINGQKAFISLGSRDTELKAARLRDCGGYALFGDKFGRVANFKREEYGEDDLREAGMELMERELGLSALKALNPKLVAALTGTRSKAGAAAAAATAGSGASQRAEGRGGGSKEVAGAAGKGSLKRRHQDLEEGDSDNEAEEGHGVKGVRQQGRSQQNSGSSQQQQQKKQRLEEQQQQQQPARAVPPTSPRQQKQQQQGQADGEFTTNIGYERVMVAPGVYARRCKKEEDGISYMPFFCGMGTGISFLHVGTFKDKEEAIRARDLYCLVLAGPDCATTTYPIESYSLAELQQVAEELQGNTVAAACLGSFRLDAYEGKCMGAREAGSAGFRSPSKVGRGQSRPPASPAAAAKVRAASQSPRQQQQQGRRSLGVDVGGGASAAAAAAASGPSPRRGYQLQQQIGPTRRSLGLDVGASGAAAAASPRKGRDQQDEQQQQQSRRSLGLDLSASGRLAAAAAAGAKSPRPGKQQQQHKDVAGADDGDQYATTIGYEKVLVAPGIYARRCKREEEGISYMPFFCGMGTGVSFLHLGTFKDMEEAIKVRDLCILVLVGPESDATSNPIGSYRLAEVQDAAEKLKGQAQAAECLARFRLEQYKGKCAGGVNSNSAAAAGGAPVGPIAAAGDVGSEGGVKQESSAVQQKVENS